MILLKREYTADVINEHGVLSGCVYASGRMSLPDAFLHLLAQKKHLKNKTHLVNLRRIT